MDKTTFALPNGLPHELVLKALTDIYPETDFEYIGDGVLVSTDAMVAYKVNSIKGIIRGIGWVYDNFQF